MFIIAVVCFTVLHAQETNLNDLKSSEKLIVKHYDLRTQTQEMWEVEKSKEDTQQSEFTAGYKGAITNAYSIDNHLKALDLTEIFEEYPPYPERTILLTGNIETQEIGPSVLIDPKHLLSGGSRYFDIQESPGTIRVTSLDGYKLLDDLGYATATDIYCFETDTTDYRNLMTLITLDRPLGAIIGWMGYGYSNNDSYYNENTLYLTALKTDESSPYTLEKYTATPDLIHEDAIYFKPYTGLISGAPLYNSNGATLGILSHSGYVKINDVVTKYHGVSRMTSTKYNTIASIIASDIPDEPDVMPLHLSVEPGIINPSTPFNEFVFHLHNYSKSTYSGPVNIDIYLSSDTNIDTTDTKLTSYTLESISLSSLYSGYLSPENKPVLPADLTSGLYFLGAIIDTDDANLGNNTTPPSECAAVLVLNPGSSNYISGKITTGNDGPGEGYCMLFASNNNCLKGVAAIATVGADLNFKFENINDGSYIIAYIPLDSYGHRNIPTYYNGTPYWQDATVIEVSSSDTVKDIQLARIELPAFTGTKNISGALSTWAEKSGNILMDDFFDDVTLILKNETNQSIASSCCPGTDGNYVFENLSDGTYLVSIDKPGFTQTEATQVTLTDEVQSVENINFKFNSDSTIVASSGTGVPLRIEENLIYAIYPNPVSNLLTVKTTVETIENNATLVIYASNGKTVSSYSLTGSETTEIDTKNLPSGLYFLKLVTQDKTHSQKFIKK